MESNELQHLNLARETVTLAVSAASWLDDAMKCWASGDYAKVGLLAPMAVEHLGKAVLWHNNPVLLVQLDEKDESSLFTLATNPHLGAAIRTITLRQVLNRTERIMGGPPQLIKSRKDRMVNVRNGVTHTGTAADLSRHVLLDALTLAQAMLAHLGIAPSVFFAAHTGHVTELLDASKSETGIRVLEKHARASQRIESLKESLSEAEYLATAARIEDQREYLVGPADVLGTNLEAIDQDCPV